MIRIIANVSLRRLMRARLSLPLTQDDSLDPPLFARLFKHAEQRFVYRTPPVLDAQGKVVTPAGPPIVTFDVLIDRDSDDLPPAVVTFLRNRAEVIYVAEWDMRNSAPFHARDNPDGYRVWKGADPGYHKFAGWPV